MARSSRREVRIRVPVFFFFFFPFPFLFLFGSLFLQGNFSPKTGKRTLLGDLDGVQYCQGLPGALKLVGHYPKFRGYDSLFLLVMETLDRYLEWGGCFETKPLS